MKKNWLMQHLSTSPLCALFVIMFFSTTAVFGQTIQLPQTGQTKCWDTAGTEVTCAGTGQDGEYRMGVSWPNPRFSVTYCNAAGPCGGQATDCDGNAANDVVTDDLTGLMWARNGNLTDARIWNDAIDYANGLALCGYTDWLLPNIIELESLLNANETNQASRLNAQGFLNVQPTGYWSSTSVLSSNRGDHKWSVDMFYMGVGHVPMTGTGSVLPVRGITSPPAELWKTGRYVTGVARTGDDGDLHRGVPWPDPRFSVTYCNAAGPCGGQATDCDGNAANDVVTDNLTGLMWTKGAALHTATSWQGALDYANNLTLCGDDDWRLPNIKEVISVMDWFQFDPCLPPAHPFDLGITTTNAYWSSTTLPGWPNNAWAFKIFDYTYSAAGPGFTGKNNAGMMAWPVRGGSKPVSSFALAVLRSGSGSGTVTSESTGIACGTDCEETYPAGTQVTLSATADTGSIFEGWSGGGCSGTGVCEIIMNANTAVIATFAVSGAPPVLSVNEGSIGTELTITGSGFGTKKGKVLIGGLKQKIDSWTPTSISVTVSKVPLPAEMAYEVSIQSKEPKGIPPVNLTGGFTVRLPQINPANPQTGASEQPVSLTGKWLGTKKGGVYVGDQKCKVMDWSMNPTTGESTLAFVVHKKITAGPHSLSVQNKVGKSLPFDFTVSSR